MHEVFDPLHKDGLAFNFPKSQVRILCLQARAASGLCQNTQQPYAPRSKGSNFQVPQTFKFLPVIFIQRLSSASAAYEPEEEGSLRLGRVLCWSGESMNKIRSVKQKGLSSTPSLFSICPSLLTSRQGGEAEPSEGCSYLTRVAPVVIKNDLSLK